MNNQRYRNVVALWRALACFFMLGCVNVLAQETAEEKLAELQTQLKKRQETLKANQANAQELQAILAESEQQIGRAAKALNDTQQGLSTNRQQQEQLEAEQQSLKDAIVEQQSLLASQLRSAFMAGHYDYAKMVFYQEEAKSFERVLAYYKYVSQARKEEINRFKSNVAKLEQVNVQLEQKATELNALLSRQQNQKATLLARQDDREQTLARLNQKIATDAAQVQELRASEQALIDAVEEARRAAERAKQTMDGLAQVKGKLPVPADGRVRRLFGERRQGQVRWKGIVIEASEGRSVNVIAAGQVLYANWLKGFGLVTIVDHGKGYMSVYGHNQALLKQAGDKVVQGDAIALVGQSGGQSYPNLYFEIRHKGKALNPASWLNI